MFLKGWAAAAEDCEMARLFSVRRAAFLLVVAAAGVGSVGASAGVALGEKPNGTPPKSLTIPALTGTAASGKTLSSSTGTWSGTQPIYYVYQWLRCDGTGAACAPISGATG